MASVEHKEPAVALSNAESVQTENVQTIAVRDEKNMQHTTEPPKTTATMNEKAEEKLEESSIADTGSSNPGPSKNDAVNTEEELEDDGINANYAQGWKLWTLTAGLCLILFTVGLDQSILATAIPKIVSQFHSLDDVGWYASAYLLCTTALQPSFGKIYTYFNIKYTCITALVIFEVGSIVCATAEDSLTLIIGRAVAGTGAAGLYSGTMTIIAFAVPLRQRPIYMALLSSMFSIASIVGPILGGAFTDSHLTWRWCFWINLPIGGVAIATILFFFHNPDRKYVNISLKQKFLSMDPLGATFLVGAIVCLLLALQWGGLTYAWSDSKVWGNLLGAGLIAVAFLITQWRQKENATIPLKMLKQRTVLASCLVLIFLSMGLYVHIYYVPFWFQAVKGTSARQSGINIIPFLLSTTLASIVSGALTTIFGYYNPFIIFGSALFTVGAGLVYTFNPGTDTGRWIGYQILTGTGAGCAIQLPFVAVQVVLPPKQVPVGNAVAVFFNTLGGAIAVAAATNIFDNELAKQLFKINVSDLGLNPEVIIHSGPAAIRTLVPPANLAPVLVAVNNALRNTFILPLSVGAAAFVCSFLFEWRTVKGKKIEHGAGGA